MIVPGDKRVVNRAGLVGFRTGAYYVTANPGGLAGSALMTWFAVITIQAPFIGASDPQWIFGRGNYAANGYFIRAVGSGTNQIEVGATNGAGGTIRTGPTLTAADVGKMIILIGTWNNGTVVVATNSVQQTTSGGTGFTAYVGATAIGINPAFVNTPATDIIVHDCGVLDGYDMTATLSAQTATWQEDLQQGRYLTWPRTMTANDVYWSARDAVYAGGKARPTFNDRSSGAVTMTRTGTLNCLSGASVPPRF